MGLFPNYNKPGPGVDKNAPKKKGVALYFELFFRHFWDFIKENMLYVLFSLPMFLVLYFMVSIFDVFSIGRVAAENDLLLYYEALKLFYIITVLILCGSGPASAAMAYMMRCVTRETHCFLWSDFLDKLKENFKQGLLLSVMDVLLLTLILPVAIRFYYLQMMQTGQLVWMILLALLTVAVLAYVLLHQYFYQFIITFKLTFAAALKNSLLMALSYLPFGVLFMAVAVVLTYFLATTFQPMFTLLLSALCWIAFLRYPLEFFAARVIERKLLPEQAESVDGE